MSSLNRLATNSATLHRRMNFRKYKDGTIINRKKWSANWGPEAKQFVSMMYYAKNSRQVTNPHIQLYYYFISDPNFWTVEVPWKRSAWRFAMEQSFTWVRVYKALEKCSTKHEFFELMGLTEDEVNELVWKDMTRNQFPAIAKKFGKEKEYEKLILTPKGYEHTPTI